jgi:hypothetical protein
MAEELRSVLDLEHSRLAAPPSVDDGRHDVYLYASTVATLDALLYRAAGRLKDDKVPRDQEPYLSFGELYDELSATYPKLRQVRNAVFAHPPFADSGTSLMWTSESVILQAIDDDPSPPWRFVQPGDDVIVPLECHPHISGLVERFLALIRQQT